MTEELSGIEKIEVGFEGENHNEFKDKPKPAQLLGNDCWVASLPTKEVEPGATRFWSRRPTKSAGSVGSP